MGDTLKAQIIACSTEMVIYSICINKYIHMPFYSNYISSYTTHTHKKNILFSWFKQGPQYSKG